MSSTDVSICYGVQLKDKGPRAFSAMCLQSFAARCNLFAMKTFADQVNNLASKFLQNRMLFAEPHA